MAKKEVEFLPVNESVSLTEFPLAVTLMCLNCPLLAIDENPRTPDRVDFVFSRERAAMLIQAYWAGSLLVDPKQFWNISRELKSRIRQR